MHFNLHIFKYHKTTTTNCKNLNSFSYQIWMWNMIYNFTAFYGFHSLYWKNFWFIFNLFSFWGAFKYCGTSYFSSLLDSITKIPLKKGRGSRKKSKIQFHHKNQKMFHNFWANPMKNRKKLLVIQLSELI